MTHRLTAAILALAIALAGPVGTTTNGYWTRTGRADTVEVV